MGLGWGVAYQVFFGLRPDELSERKAQFLFWTLFLVSWIGAKSLFYYTLPEHLAHNLLTQVTFWTGGGFVFYGGLLAGLIYLTCLQIFGFKLKIDILWPLVPALTLGHAIGRIGCFLAGCCYGKETDFWWGVYQHDHYRHPTQILESLGLFVLGYYLLKAKKSKSVLLAQYFILYGIIRFGVETLRGDEIRGEWGSLSPSQWISIFLILLGTSLMFRNRVSSA